MSSMEEKSKEIKGIIRIYQSMKDKQHNEQSKDQTTKNDQQYTRHKAKE